MNLIESVHLPTHVLGTRQVYAYYKQTDRAKYCDTDLQINRCRPTLETFIRTGIFPITFEALTNYQFPGQYTHVANDAAAVIVWGGQQTLVVQMGH